jgi:hypothetical protein
MAIAEFIVAGTPISSGARGRSRTRWKEAVSSAASAALPHQHALVADSVRVTVVYFYVRTDLDLDNILKPILDALIEVIYVNDFQVTDISASKRDQTGTLILEGASPVIIEQLASAAEEPQDFVYVAVELANLATFL